MSGQGTVTLDFGAFPGSTDTSVSVTGQTGILSGSLIEAWILPAATTDHTADEHVLESIYIYARDIVAGSGFTIQGVSEGQVNGIAQLIYGQWNIAFVWA